MKSKSIVSTFLFRAAALSIACVALPLAAQTLVPGVNGPDPARWTQEDMTRAQKLSTAQKEAVNAQQASIDDCASKPMNTRQACVAQARMYFAEDEAAIRKTFGATK